MSIFDPINKFKAILFSGVLTGVIAALFYYGVSTTRLQAQGLYYDELHQAAPAFAYIGRPVTQFSFLVVRGLPFMNMSYSGAIKTAFYGLYLKESGSPFTVRSWRLTGILFISAGLLLFAFILRKVLPLPGLLVFYLFLLTDVTFILTTRHDWGPVALAAFFRLLLIAVWLRGELSQKPGALNSFWLGCLVGISIFEKLSSIILLVPLFLMLFASPLRRTWKHLLAAAGGGLLGVSPLIFANTFSYINYGNLISLQLPNVPPALSASGFVSYLAEFLSMGAGSALQSFILGHSQPTANTVEICLLSLTLVGLLLLLARSKALTPLLRSAGVMLSSYLGIFLAFYFFPQTTGYYHWIVSTPFQYIALALLVVAAQKGEIEWKGLVSWKAGLALLLVFSLFRAGGLIMLEQSLLRGDASETWDHSLTSIGQFAGQNANKAVFIAVDWGTANQMICFTNGQPGVVYEVSTKFGEAQGNVLYILKNVHRSQFYLVFRNLSFIGKEHMISQLTQQVAQALAPDWQQQPVEDVVQDFTAVSVVKFVRIK